MKITKTPLEGVLLVDPPVFRDPRGFFLESWNARSFAAAGLDVQFVQDNQSRSQRGTLRGLHAQRKTPQGKLVRCVRGAIWDVAVDIRPDSKTFGQHFGAELSEENFRELWIPPGFAHGFCVLSEVAEVLYKASAFYDRADEIGVRWDDPDLALPWPVKDPLLSPKDLALPTLKELRSVLPA